MRHQLKKQIVLLQSFMSQLPWDDEHFYAQYLAQTYYYVCHSTRLLALAASHFQVDRESLHRRFGQHLSEEKGHEHLALNDLKNLKQTLQSFPELPVTRAFYEPQYYKIQYQCATALFGYILLLEQASVQVGPDIYHRVKKTYGTKSSHFLRTHVEDDPDHVEKALEFVMQLPEREREYIEQNLIQTNKLYMILLDSLNTAEGEQTSQKAA